MDAQNTTFCLVSSAIQCRELTIGKAVLVGLCETILALVSCPKLLAAAVLPSITSDSSDRQVFTSLNQKASSLHLLAAAGKCSKPSGSNNMLHHRRQEASSETV